MMALGLRRTAAEGTRQGAAAAAAAAAAFAGSGISARWVSHMGDNETMPLRVKSRGKNILTDPLWNKGMAHDASERERLGLRGLLPPRIISMDMQVHVRATWKLTHSTPTTTATTTAATASITATVTIVATTTTTPGEALHGSPRR